MSGVRTDRTRPGAGGRPRGTGPSRRGGSGSSVAPPARPAPRPTPPGGRRRPWAAAFADLRLAVSHAVGAVAVGLLACVGLVVLGWATEASSGTSWWQAVRLGADLWLLAHLGELAVVSEVVSSTSPADPATLVPGTVSLAPLGLSLVAATLAWRAGRRTARRCTPVRSLLLCLAVAAVYAGAAWGLAWAVDTAVLAPVPSACAVGAAVLALLGSAAGVLSVHGGSLTDRLPHVVAVQLRRVLPAAGVALAVWLLAGAVLLAVGLLLDLPTAAGVHGALAPGAVGGLLLLLAQVAYLPGATVWSGSVLAGPGTRFSDGVVTLSGSTVVDVPAVPLLAALPVPGPFPLWAYLGPLLVVLAGALAGWHTHRDPSSRGATLTDRLADAVAVAALVGIAVAGLVRVSSGALGPWAPLGPDLLLVVAAVTAEVLVGGLLVGAALHLLSGRPIGRRRSDLRRAGAAGAAGVRAAGARAVGSISSRGR
ncbi:cell division protein PerM [Aquipuribacter sp. MA13-6]|uniref:cell division protein PerM n=1 Tax=unclassified Aquipuribacter TaxID=2635084 RepID=UPI003EEA19D2